MATEVKVLFHPHKSSSLFGNFPVLSFQLRKWTALSQAVSCTQDRGNTGSRGTDLCVPEQVSPAEVGRCLLRARWEGLERAGLLYSLSSGALGAGSVTKAASHLCVQQI